MKILLWLGGAVLFGVAALAVYMAFQSPAFVAGLSGLAAAAAAKAIKEMVVKPETPEARVIRIEEYRRGHGDDDWRRKSGAPPKG